METRLSDVSSQATLHDYPDPIILQRPPTMTSDVERQVYAGSTSTDACHLSPDTLERGYKCESEDLPVTTGGLLARLDHACLNLSPSFFSLNMGTGIVSILLHGLPYNAEWLRIIAVIIFILNVVLFVVFAVGTIIRHLRWKGIFTALGRHLQAGMFWGCLPMGLVTIVNMTAVVCVPKWGWRWAQLALGLWWIDIILAIFINFGMIFMIFTRQEHSLQSITAPLLLPIVTSVVAAASGGVVASALAPFDPYLARSTLVVSYVVWGTGVPIALFVITLWIYRTAVHSVPKGAALPTIFLPLGPCGQGSYGIALLGSVVRELAYVHGLGFTVDPATGASTAAAIRVADGIYAAGLITSLILWGLGFVWYTLGMVITIDHAIKNKRYFHHSSFAIGWTAYTFPIGVWACASVQLAKELDSPAFKIIGTVVSLQVTFQWAYVFVMSLHTGWKGSLFSAPELSKWEGKRPPLRWS